MSYGFTFGGSQTMLRGTVNNINRPSDIEGVYGAAGAGATVIRGPQAIVLTNQKGALLRLTGNQTGLMVNLGSERDGADLAEVGHRTCDRARGGRHRCPISAAP